MATFLHNGMNRTLQRENMIHSNYFCRAAELYSVSLAANVHRQPYCHLSVASHFFLFLCAWRSLPVWRIEIIYYAPGVHPGQRAAGKSASDPPTTQRRTIFFYYFMSSIIKNGFVYLVPVDF